MGLSPRLQIVSLLCDGIKTIVEASENLSDILNDAFMECTDWDEFRCCGVACLIGNVVLWPTKPMLWIARMLQ